MNTTKKIPVFAAALLLLAACNNSEKTENTETLEENNHTVSQDSANVEDTYAAGIPNQTRYFYEPDTSIVTGRIITKTFFGPPNYGENPETDSKENCYLVVLPQAVKVFSNSQEQEEEGIDVSKQDIDSIQLIVDQGLNMKDFLDKKVQLNGTFTGAITGHHHTPVLLEVWAAKTVK